MDLCAHAAKRGLERLPVTGWPMRELLSLIRIAIQEGQQTHCFALLHELASHFENEQATGGMPGKIVGPGWLNRADLLHEVGREYFQLRLMVVDERGELETIHGLFRPQLGGKIDEAQQAAPNAMCNK